MSVSSESISDEWCEFQDLMKSRMDINICLLGTVSAGKTTFLNTLFTNTYGDMKIRRTTMTPQVYHESTSIDQIIDPKTIRQRNKEINDQLQGKQDLDITDIRELEHFVPKIENFVDLQSNVFLSVYDIPGLNDAHTKSVYYKYVENNFHKFDIIIFLIDINSGLNTSDEIDLLNMIIGQIDVNQKRNLVQKLLIITNKCDNYDDDDEVKEMYKQVVTIIKSKTEGKKIDYKIMRLVCENAYISRMIANRPDIELDKKYYSKIGISKYGEIKWKKMGEDKIDQIKKKIKSGAIKYEDEQFEKITQYISNYLNRQTQYLILQNRIKYFWSIIISTLKSSCLIISSWNVKNTKDMLEQIKKDIMIYLSYAKILQKKYKITETKVDFRVIPLMNEYLVSYFEIFTSPRLNELSIDIIIIIKEHLEHLSMEINDQIVSDPKCDQAIQTLRQKINSHYVASFRSNPPVSFEDAEKRFDLLYQNKCYRIHQCINIFLINCINNQKIEIKGEIIYQTIQNYAKKYHLSNDQIIQIILDILPSVYQMVYQTNKTMILYINEYLPEIQTQSESIHFEKYHRLRIYVRMLLTSVSTCHYQIEEYEKWYDNIKNNYGTILEKQLVSLLHKC